MAVGTKTGGRKKGTKNKRTLALEAAGIEIVNAIENELGEDCFKGDAHALLLSVYKNKKLPMEMRTDAAKTAVRYEKAALSSVESKITDERNYVARVPHPSANTGEWMQQYGDLKTGDVKPGDKAKLN